MRRLAILWTLAVLVLLGACTATDAGETRSTAVSSPTTAAPLPPETTPSTNAPRSESTTTEAALPTGEEDGAAQRSSLARSVRDAGSAIYRPPEPPPPAPVALSIEAIGIERAPIVPVGVLAGGDMEIPGVTEVGWYRFGPRPGDDGSAVLAAHIAFDRRPGVFRRLDRLAPGDTFTVWFDDGQERRFEVTEKVRYPKDELPESQVFERDGDPSVALVTCGGAFDRTSRTYEDNVVVYALPAS